MTPTPATANTHIYGNSTSQRSVFDKIWRSPLDQKILAATTCLAFPLVGSGLFSNNKDIQRFSGASLLSLGYTTWAVTKEPKFFHMYPALTEVDVPEQTTLITAAAFIYGIGFSGKLPEETPAPVKLGCFLGGTLFLYSFARMFDPPRHPHPFVQQTDIKEFMLPTLTIASLAGSVAYRGLPSLIKSIQDRC